MKLPVPFIQLPLRFDAAALAAEIARFDEPMWRPHPDGMPGNAALPLVAVDGDPARGDSVEGPMRPTPALLQSPYLLQVLGSLDAVIGRTRLMRLSGRAEVRSHIDTDYYWHDRVRVHVPIVTQPSVRFTAGGAHVHMAAGECWIFDTWLLHHVANDHDADRIHLVVDTVGGAAFWNLVSGGRPHAASPAGWSARMIAPQSGATPPLMFESVNSQSPMSYWELRGLISFLLGEVDPHPRMPMVAQLCQAFAAQWQTLWFRHGTDAAALPEYARVLDGFLARAVPLARGIPTRTGGDFANALHGLFKRAVRRDDAAAGGGTAARREREAAMPAQAVVRGEEIERPVFIVSSPRSGSTLLFETLARSPDACTIGGESHVLIESIAALDASSHGYESNRLRADEATPEIAAELRRRFREELFDRDMKARPGRVRMLEKTPKNSLRIPFLRAVFPDAHFVYLYRDPREVLASMMEAWESGRFRTYPRLPGWSGPPWSLLLVPGWRDLVGKSIPEIVATQWEATTRILLDDLDAVPPAQRSVARYDALLADPAAEIARICAVTGLAWDQPLGADLPIARHTVSAPQPGKWRRREAELAPHLDRIAATMARAEAFAAR